MEEKIMSILLPIKNAAITQRFDVGTATGGSHIHGAIDLEAPNGVGTLIIAPEDGCVYGYRAIRQKDGLYWPKFPKVHEYEKFTFCNYFYDMFGGVTFLESADGKRTHLFCHSYQNQIFNIIFADAKKYVIEQKDDARFPILGLYTEKVKVKAGDLIAYVGHSGYNLGVHLHWETHAGLNNQQTYSNRIDPETLLDKKDIKYK